MTMITEVSRMYFDLTSRVVSELTDKAIEDLSGSSGIPSKAIRDFRDNGEDIDGSYIPALYSQLFSDLTPLQAHVFLHKELTQYTEFLNRG
jgi:hypothetical protein